MTIFLRLLLIALIVRAVWALLSGIIEGATGKNVPDRSKHTVSLARDPVCGTYVARTRALVAKSGGRTLYFCSERCREQHARSNR